MVIYSDMMSKNRIEAFSDGVIAIIITIMVFDLKIPELADNFTDTELHKALWGILPKLAAYTLSFIVVAIMWLNHHSLFDKIPHSTSKLIWYNAFLLFGMSLIPLPTAFLAAHPFLPEASMLYGLVLGFTALGFTLLRAYAQGKAKLISYNQLVQRSNMIGTSLYFLSAPLAFVSVYLSFAIFMGIPLWYFLPDKFQK